MQLADYRSALPAGFAVPGPAGGNRLVWRAAYFQALAQAAGQGWGCAVCVFGAALGTFFTLLTARPETVGDWRGQKVVMQELTWMETTYSYYAYNGPFLLGESLGWSEEPWGEDLN